MKVLPHLTSNRVILRQHPPQQKAGSLIIPETAGKKPLTGTVIAVSDYFVCPKNGLVHPIVKIGDTVQYENHTGAPIEVDNEEAITVLEYNIICIL